MKQTIERSWDERGLPMDTVLNALKSARTLDIHTVGARVVQITKIVIDNGDVTITIAN